MLWCVSLVPSGQRGLDYCSESQAGGAGGLIKPSRPISTPCLPLRQRLASWPQNAADGLPRQLLSDPACTPVWRGAGRAGSGVPLLCVWPSSCSLLLASVSLCLPRCLRLAPGVFQRLHRAFPAVRWCWQAQVMLLISPSLLSPGAPVIYLHRNREGVRGGRPARSPAWCLAHRWPRPAGVLSLPSLHLPRPSPLPPPLLPSLLPSITHSCVSATSGCFRDGGL